MLNLVTKVTASVASISAHKPIHFTILTSFLASIAYLAVVDEYIPESFDNSGLVSYYHPPGSSTYNGWTKVEDVSLHADADQISLVPLVFKRMSQNPIPEIENTFPGVSSDRILIVPSRKVDQSLADLSKITYEGITWKTKGNNMLRRYISYLKSGAKRLKALTEGAEKFDISLIAVAYFAMIYTILKVFIDLREGGSKFWLAFSTILSSAYAFIFALAVTTKFLNVKVSLLSLTEGIPFLTAVVGFKHKISIASTVTRASSNQDDVKHIVSSVIANHSVSLLRDNLIVIAAFLIAFFSIDQMEGLRNFCLLSGLILLFDLMLVYTFYAAVLALKVEINRARRTHELQDALEEEGVSSFVAANIASRASKAEYKGQSRFGSSVVSVKVALLGLFIAIHAFWIGSSWLYETASFSGSSAPETLELSKNAAKHITVGPHGTVVTILASRIYVPVGVMSMIEDFVFAIIEKVSSAIRDSIISKFLLFGFAISISTNAYFLNATRFQRNAANMLIESQPKQKVIEKIRTVPSFESDTDDSASTSDGALDLTVPARILPLEECIKKMKEGKVKELNNSEVSSLVVAGQLPLYALEKQLGNNARAVVVRRKAIAKLANAPVLESNKLPHAHYDYDRVFGACCENVIGYMPLPVGVAGPLIIDGTPYHIPMATTEGCLVASTMRGCKAINAGGGVETIITQDGMTRGPCVSFSSLARAGACKLWLDSEEGQKTIKKAFNSTSRFARLQHIKTAIAGTLLFIRFKTTTGDAMGMNMISKGVEYSLKYMAEECGWDDMSVIAVSGNYCTDKKPAAINWIEGRGKSVVAEARIPLEVVQKVLKSDVDALVELNISKNLIGSAMAGSVGGFNAHAANLVTAVYLACGQDPAQNVESSNCMTLMNRLPNGDLQISVSMPSIEVGTIGGGTILEPQGAMLELLGVRGPHPTNPGDNSRRLACIVASAVLAAELSLCSALAAGHLVQSHMQHNRKGAAAPAAETKKVPDVQRLQEGSVTCIKS